MFGSFGWMELMLILIIVLIIFGAGKLPQLGEGLGKAIKGFKKTVHEADAIDVTPGEQAPAAQAPPTQIAGQAQAQAAPPPAAPVQQSEQTKQG
ncbi:twin-arginine translocase TatA/TatE family subunit [Nitrospira sp. NS4]|uniref:twin-arginine translocase TatA/TatE family subunit n=1 Tax=Nitrospira sp. NS4 TaxID=3414498 RepID=UPI003C2FBE65